MEHTVHIFRKRGSENHLLSGNGVEKCQPVGVQRLSADEFHIGIVKIVSNEGMTDMFHMNTDLMGTARLQGKGDKAVPVFFLQDAVVCDRIFTVFKIDLTFDLPVLPMGASIVPPGGLMPPRTIARYSLVISWRTPIQERMLELTMCFAITVRPEVSRSRRFVHRKMNGLPCS